MKAGLVPISYPFFTRSRFYFCEKPYLKLRSKNKIKIPKSISKLNKVITTVCNSKGFTYNKIKANSHPKETQNNHKIQRFYSEKNTLP